MDEKNEKRNFDIINQKVNNDTLNANQRYQINSMDNELEDWFLN